jgi:hypothetical protein
MSTHPGIRPDSMEPRRLLRMGWMGGFCIFMTYMPAGLCKNPRTRNGRTDCRKR